MKTSMRASAWLKCLAAPTTWPLSVAANSLNSPRIKYAAHALTSWDHVTLSIPKVIVWDDSKQKVALALELRARVHRVRISRSRIMVALRNNVHVYEFCSPPKKLFVFETTDNLSGLCCLGSKVVVFPGQTAGKVQLVELDTGNISIIPAHDNPLQALDLSPNGELLATASEKVS